MLLKLIRALLVASVVVPIVALGLFARHTHKEYVRAAQDRAQRLASVVQEHTLKVFETMGLVLHTADQNLRGPTGEQIATSRTWGTGWKRPEPRGDQVGGSWVMTD